MLQNRSEFCVRAGAGPRGRCAGDPVQDRLRVWRPSSGRFDHQRDESDAFAGAGRCRAEVGAFGLLVRNGRRQRLRRRSPEDLLPLGGGDRQVKRG